MGSFPQRNREKLIDFAQTQDGVTSKCSQKDLLRKDIEGFNDWAFEPNNFEKRFWRPMSQKTIPIYTFGRLSQPTVCKLVYIFISSHRGRWSLLVFPDSIVCSSVRHLIPFYFFLLTLFIDSVLIIAHPVLNQKIICNHVSFLGRRGVYVRGGGGGE